MAKAGQLVGLAYVAEIRANPVPRFGALGAYDADPHKGLAATSRLWTRLGAVAAVADQQSSEAAQAR